MKAKRLDNGNILVDGQEMSEEGFQDCSRHLKIEWDDPDFVDPRIRKYWYSTYHQGRKFDTCEAALIATVRYMYLKRVKKIEIELVSEDIVHVNHHKIHR